MANCFSCGTEIGNPKAVFRATRCEQCGADLRVCMNCEFYAPDAHWGCRETVPEEVRDKERANFCDYFRVRAGVRDTGVEKRAKARDNARSRLDDLFGGA